MYIPGLYIGAHGIYTSEVIQLRRRFGQWKEDGNAKEPPNVEFYEYVEATKLTGDPYVPAGQVIFSFGQVSHKCLVFFSNCAGIIFIEQWI